MFFNNPNKKGTLGVIAVYKNLIGKVMICLLNSEIIPKLI